MNEKRINCHRYSISQAEMIAIRLIIPLLFVSCIFLLMSTVSSKPEKLLKGKWKEVAWTYEKADKLNGEDTENSKLLNDEIKHHISKDLVIHQSEIWEFNDQAELILTKLKREALIIKWKLKGRGHILKLNYNDSIKEYYQIKELSNDKMVLHFENDIHTRGIVKIEFQKIK